MANRPILHFVADARGQTGRVADGRNSRVFKDGRVKGALRLCTGDGRGDDVAFDWLTGVGYSPGAVNI